MQVAFFKLGIYETNCYVIYSEKARGKCLIIDPAAEAGTLLYFMEKHQLTPEAILLTHGHYDHYLAVPKLQEMWPELPVYCHPLDCPKELVEYEMGQAFPTVTAFKNVKPLSDKQILSLMGLEIQVLHTPGHTPGSVVFMAEDALFTGDTLFCQSIGRTDFKGGSTTDMAASLKRLAALEKDYRVYPGHEELSTLEAEKLYNPYLKLL